VIDLGKACRFPFQEPGWVSKFLIGGMFMILGFFGLGIPVIAGYLVRTTQRVMRRERTLLPEWTDVGVMFVVGFKWCMVYLLYLLPVFIITLPALLLMALGALWEHGETLGVVAGVSLFVAFSLFTVAYSILISFLLPVITFEFAKRERMSDALDVGRVLRVVRHHWRDTVMVALIGIVLSVLATLGFLLFLIGILFTTFYAYVIWAYLSGELYLAQSGLEASR
jgi:hypothetical protein